MRRAAARGADAKRESPRHVLRSDRWLDARHDQARGALANPAPAKVMTRREIIEELLARTADVRRHEAEQIVFALFDAMAQALTRGERIELRGFGSFGVKDRGARRGRNPKTGGSVSVAAKRIPFFRAGKELQIEVNGAPAEASGR